MFKSILKYIGKMISNSSDVSSKRAATLFTLLNLVIFTYIATIKDVNKITPEFMFNALCLIVASGLGLTAAENVFGNNKKDSKDTKDHKVNEDVQNT